MPRDCRDDREKKRGIAVKKPEGKRAYPLAPHLDSSPHAPKFWCGFQANKLGKQICVLSPDQLEQLRTRAPHLLSYAHPYYDASYFTTGEPGVCVSLFGNDRNRIPTYFCTQILQLGKQIQRRFYRRPFTTRASSHYLVLPTTVPTDFKQIPLSVLTADAIIGPGCVVLNDGDALTHCILASHTFAAWVRKVAPTEEGQYILDQHLLCCYPWLTQETLTQAQRKMAKALQRKLLANSNDSLLEQLNRFVESLYPCDLGQESPRLEQLGGCRQRGKSQCKAPSVNDNTIGIFHPDLTKTQYDFLQTLWRHQPLSIGKASKLAGRQYDFSQRTIRGLLDRWIVCTTTTQGHRAKNTYTASMEKVEFLAQWILYFLSAPAVHKEVILQSYSQEATIVPPGNTLFPTRPEYATLKILWEHGGTTRKELSAAHCNISTLSSLLTKKLVHKKRTGICNLYLPALSAQAFACAATREILCRLDRKIAKAVIDRLL